MVFATISILCCRALASKLCPAGQYCPTPGEVYPCPVGAFCATGTVEPVTCNITTLVDKYPALDMPTTPTTVYESVYMKGTTLAGNQCPTNSSTPTKSCLGGFYCPTPDTVLLCPTGYYCKPGSQEPAKCPALASCPEGSGGNAE